MTACVHRETQSFSGMQLKIDSISILNCHKTEGKRSRCTVFLLGNGKSSGLVANMPLRVKQANPVE